MSNLARRRRRPSGGGAVTIASDSFTRADNAATLGVTEVGAKAWTNAAGGGFTGPGYAIVGNTAQPQNANRCGAYIDAGVADCTVSAVVNTATAQTGLLARFVDFDNHIRAYLNGANFVVEKLVAGVATIISNVATAWVSGDTVSLTMSGNNFTLKRNGVTLAAFTDVNSLVAATKHGLWTQATTGISEDNFAVTVP